MRLLFVGDVMLGRLVNEHLRLVPPEYPWGNTLPLFRDADLRFCNLECAISDRGKPWSATPKVFHFRSDARNVEVLKRAGIDAVSLANNHVLDFGEKALRDTLDLLDRDGIGRAGAGRNLAEAESPAVLRVEDRSVAFFAFTDNEPGWSAGKARPGVFHLPVDLEDAGAKRFFDRIREAKRLAERVIVSAHWGPNRGYEAPEEHVAFAHALVDAGADVVFGHSAHVFRGVEIHRGRPILYSAGDFVDDYAVSAVERNDESFVFVVDLHAGRPVKILFYPTVIGDMQANLAESGRADTIFRKMQELCAPFRRPIARSARRPSAARRP